MRKLEMQEWKMQHETSGVENAGAENATPNCRRWKCGS